MWCVLLCLHSLRSLRVNELKLSDCCLNEHDVVVMTIINKGDTMELVPNQHLISVVTNANETRTLRGSISSAVVESAHLVQDSVSLARTTVKAVHLELAIYMDERVAETQASIVTDKGASNV